MEEELKGASYALLMICERVLELDSNSAVLFQITKKQLKVLENYDVSKSNTHTRVIL